MKTTSKIASCIRIASEYRGVGDLRGFAEQEASNKERKLSWRSAFPDHWAPTFGGRVVQLVAIPVLLPLLLFFVLVIVPLTDLIQKIRSGKTVLAHGEMLTEPAIDSLAEASKATTLDELWATHGLPGRMSSVDFNARCQCLERWIDILYGSGMSVVMRVRRRVEEKRSSQGKLSAEFSQAGGHISFADAVDTLVKELGKQLPPFRQLQKGVDKQ